jgi:rare lipoprotein A (peptidoglycan hydrolase)
MRRSASRITTLAAALALAATTPAAAQDVTPPTGGAQATTAEPGLVVSPGALLARTVTIRGVADPSDSGRPVRVERLLADGTWALVGATVVGEDGTYSTGWLTEGLGRVTLRAVVERDAAATAAAEPLTAQLTIFQPATASWYGPGFYGRRTACGLKLTRATLGVAHRSLPCGTEVELYHRGRTLTVPVIDRGPFHPGRDWDVTQAAALALGMRASARIGFLPPPGVALPARAAARAR